MEEKEVSLEVKDPIVQKDSRIHKDAIANIEVKCDECNKTGPVVRLGETPLPLFNWLTSYYACGFCGGKSIFVMQPPIVKDKEKRATLHILLNSFNLEITRYRDYEWKLIIWQIFLSWTLYLASVGFNNLNEETSIILDVLIGLLLILSTTLLSANLMFIHGELTTNRNWRRQTERMLDIYSGIKILPENWKNYMIPFNQGKDPFIIPFFLFMWITGLGLTYAIASKHQIPILIISMGKGVVLLWKYFIPLIILALIYLESLYIIKSVVKQGLTKDGSY